MKIFFKATVYLLSLSILAISCSHNERIIYVFPDTHVLLEDDEHKKAHSLKHDENSKISHTGRITHIFKDNKMLIEDIEYKKVYSYKHNQNSNLKVGYVVTFKVKGKAPNKQVYEVKVKDSSHSARFWHPEYPDHVYGHIKPFITNEEYEPLDYDGKKYIKANVSESDDPEEPTESSPNCTTINYDFHTKWVLRDFYNAKKISADITTYSYKDSCFYFTYLTDQNGMTVKFDSLELLVELLDYHPNHK